MSQGITSIDINEINFSLIYEGYLWYSDNQKPKIFPNKDINFEPACFSDLPFIIEGNLYSEAKGISINIRHRDGKYHIIKFDINLAKNHYPNHVQTYIGHDTNEQDFNMLEAWEETSSQELEGMPSLIPSWTAFIGFVQ